MTPPRPAAAAATASPGHRRQFVSRVSQREAFRFVAAGVALSVLAAGLSLAATGDLPLVTVLFCGAVLFHFWPFLAPRQPPLVMDASGIELDGFGRIGWGEVRRIAVPLHGHDQRPLPVVWLELTRSPAAIQASQRPLRGPGWRQLQARVWARAEPNIMALALGNLEDSPGEIKEAMTILSGLPVVPAHGTLA